MQRWGHGGAFDVDLIEHTPGYALMHVSGSRSVAAFANESGGHRFQRIPPTERRGRVHTSTITVAVLAEPTEHALKLDPRDIEETTCRASGPGGQNIQKSTSAVQMKHIPTGTIVRCETERSQTQNRALALSILRTRLGAQQKAAVDAQRNNQRRQQIGSGQRGDKIRTVRMQDGVVTDHRSEQKMSLDRYLRGESFGG